ncbi:Myb-like_DNA-binding domain-containing protein [Hexamita inflata]|uniref:Myb-like DNA-binding domain-containing protein n=1 Tax=Hexamita inflata TaxID=28002 RepID=A0AA86U8P5_9EUKA|nr:Myb-like DNA-binding domain-containing protein [Hexamita inflata]
MQKRIAWTQSEIQQLIQLTENNRVANKQIKWNLVAEQIPTRSASQCKSYYANVLKKNMDVEIRQNHMWNRVEILALWVFCVIHNKDFNLIQQNFMSKFTVKQISSQYVQIARKQQQMYSLFKKILNDPNQVQTISEADFKMQWWILRMVIRRMKMINVRILQRVNDEIPETKYSLDLAELPAMTAFFLDIDPHDLISTYQAEEIRRGLDKEPFYIPQDKENFMK